MDDKKKARVDGGRRFQREGPATEKDLDLAIVVLVKKGSHVSTLTFAMTAFINFASFKFKSMVISHHDRNFSANNVQAVC